MANSLPLFVLQVKSFTTLKRENKQLDSATFLCTLNQWETVAAGTDHFGYPLFSYQETYQLVSGRFTNAFIRFSAVVIYCSTRKLGQ